jgi:hypothetical protein
MDEEDMAFDEYGGAYDNSPGCYLAWEAAASKSRVRDMKVSKPGV